MNTQPLRVGIGGPVGSGKTALTLALCLHLAGGIRHLIWDAGRGLSTKSADALSWASMIGGVVIAVAFWAVLFASGRVVL